MPTEVGTAYVSLVPSAKGFASKMQAELGGEIPKIGGESGGQFSEEFSKKAGGGLKGRVKGMFSGVAGSLKGMVGVAAGAFALDKVTGFLKDSIAEGRESQVVTARTTNVIKRMGAESWTSAKAIGNLATSLSNKTGIDDEAIQSGSNLLLTFGNIRNEAGKGNDIFNQTTGLMVDMSKAMGTDVKSSAIQLGKALNDPTKGLTALSRVGVSFSDSEQKQIKTLQAHGKTLAAQKIILGEVKKEFGGAAAAMATPAEKAQVAWGNFKEAIGTALIPIVDKILNVFAALLPKVLVIGQAVGKVLGPAFKAVGHVIGGLLPSFNNLGKSGGSVFSTMAKTFQTTILPALQRLGGFLQATILPVFRAVVKTIMNGFVPAIVAVAKFIYGQVYPAVFKIWGAVAHNLAPAFRALANAFRTQILPTIQKLMVAFKTQLLPAIKPVVMVVLRVVGVVLRLASAILGKVLPVIIKLAAWIISHLVVALARIVIGVIKVISAIVRFGAALVRGGAAVLRFAARIAVGVAKAVAWFATLPIRAANAIKPLIGHVVSIVSNAMQAAGKAALNGVSRVVSFIGQLPGKVAALAGHVASAAVSVGRSIMSGLWNGLKSMIGGAMDIGSAIKSGVNSALGLPRHIGFSIMGKSLGVTIPAFATGARFEGPTYGLMGEGNEPETLFPDSKLRDFLAHMTERATANMAVQHAGGRYALTITNWEQGTGYIERVADGRVNAHAHMAAQTRRAS